MALSDLNLTFSACIEGDCTSMSVNDTTGLYDAISNTGGWDDRLTIFAAKITSATIAITTPSGSTLTEDVTSQLPDAVTGEFSFTDITLPAAEDGEYTITYTVAEGNSTLVKTIKIYSLCKSRACVDQMWANYALNEYTTSTCNCSQKTLSLKDTAMMGEALYKAISSSAICNSTIRDQLLAKLTRLCNLQDCNCD